MQRDATYKFGQIKIYEIAGLHRLNLNKQERSKLGNPRHVGKRSALYPPYIVGLQLDRACIKIFQALLHYVGNRCFVFSVIHVFMTGIFFRVHFLYGRSYVKLVIYCDASMGYLFYVAKYPVFPLLFYL